METTLKNRLFIGLLFAGSLLVIPGCKWSGSTPESSSTSSSEGLLLIDGKTAITQKDFDEYFNKFLTANPAMKNMIQFVPDAKKQIFAGFVNEKIMLEWAKKAKIDKSEDYTKDLKDMQRMVEVTLAAKYFEKELVGNLEISDEEIEKYYEENRANFPDLILSQGGTKASVVEFNSKVKADLFFAKVKTTPKQVSSMAKIEKLSVKDIVISDASDTSVDSALKAKVMGAADLTVLNVQGLDDKFYVTAILSKEETKYRPFDQVKTPLQSLIKRNKATELFSKKIEELKKEYNVQENLESFESSKNHLAAPSDADLSEIEELGAESLNENHEHEEHNAPAFEQKSL